MDRQLTDLVELDVDDATKLYLLDELLNQHREVLSSSELLSLFWIAILSLSVRSILQKQLVAVLFSVIPMQMPCYPLL